MSRSETVLLITRRMRAEPPSGARVIEPLRTLFTASATATEKASTRVEGRVTFTPWHWSSSDRRLTVCCTSV